MRAFPFLLAVSLVAAPAAAQQSPSPAPKAKADAEAEVTRAMNDPATADRLARMLQILSKTFLEIPAGELKAASEGRAPTATEKKMTVREMGKADDPDFEKDLQRDLANAGPQLHSAMKVLAKSLPTIMKSMEPVAKQLEKAAGNLPSPAYPKR